MKYIKFENFINSTQYGYTAETTSPISGDAKYLRITDIVPYFVEKDRVPYCAIDASKVNKYLVHDGDVLIARTGATTGYNLVADDSFKNYVFASYLIRFNYDRKKLHPRYLKYVLKSPSWYGFVNNYIGGSAQPGMNARVFGKYYLPYTDFSTQQKIASILSAYDSLIENNKKRIKLLEQMAENLYKEWFVRFRFPGYETAEFEGEVPKGWSSQASNNRKPKGWTYGELKKLGAFVRGKNITSAEMAPGPVPVISAGIEPSGYHNQANVDGPSLTISSSGANAGFLKYNLTDIWAADCSYYNIPNNIWFVYFSLKYLRPVLRNLQCGAAQPHVYPKDVNRLCIILPPDDLIKTFERKCQMVFEDIHCLNKQIGLLTTQRDLLLPRLMSGKLSI